MRPKDSANLAQHIVVSLLHESEDSSGPVRGRHERAYSPASVPLFNSGTRGGQQLLIVLLKWTHDPFLELR